jgi:uncharacterized protein (TIGR00251 family)
MPLHITRKDGALRLRVHGKPRSKRSAVVGEREGALEVALAAPPVDGAANDELVRVLSAVLGVPRRAIRIASGEGSRHKLVDVEGLTEDELRARLGVG